jgi:hypothetical protein
MVSIYFLIFIFCRVAIADFKYAGTTAGNSPVALFPILLNGGCIASSNSSRYQKFTMVITSNDDFHWITALFQV